MENNQNNQEQKNYKNYWEKPFEEVKEKKETGEENIDFIGDDVDEEKRRIRGVKRYKDQSGLTMRKLNIGLWYIEHKNILYKILIGFLIFISAVSWPYVIYSFAFYLSRGMADDQALLNDLVNSGRINHEAIVGLSPKELSFSSISMLSAGNNKYDFFTRVSNPNGRHGAEFFYYFSVGDKNTKSLNGFILPGESKYLLSLGNEFEFRPTNTQLKINGLEWVAIDRHKIPDWKNYNDSRLNISVSGVNFILSDQTGLSDKLKLNNLEFTAENKSVFNYWDVDFIILLYGGSNIVGVNNYSLNEFMSGQTKQVSISWPGEIGRVGKIEIFPEINILNDNIYIDYRGGAGEKK